MCVSEVFFDLGAFVFFFVNMVNDRRFMICWCIYHTFTHARTYMHTYMHILSCAFLFWLCLSLLVHLFI